ncbi:thioredoxin fold domain-containing protein [bacterium]|nr:thioredoxin fold domain-containing protein [bacterium]
MPNPSRGATDQYVERPNSNSYEQQNYADFGDPAELLADRSMGSCPGGVCPTRGDSSSGPGNSNLPNLEITGTINPVENQWGDNREDYTEAIEKSGFSYSNLGNSKKNSSDRSEQPQQPEENIGTGPESENSENDNDPSSPEGQAQDSANSENRPEEEPASPSDREPPEGAVEEEEIEDGNTDNNEERQGDTARGEEGQDGGEPADDTSSAAAAANEANEDNEDAGEGESAGDNGTDSGERTLEQQYQDALRQAAEQGKPVVVVFGSQSARDTQLQTGQTLQANMNDGDAVFMYADTDNLDPNSDLGQVARRSEEDGRGLGADGKSDANLAFTGIYNVEQRPDGSFGLGNSVATFQGGRSEITDIMREQMQYAKRSTLDLRKDNSPDVQPSQPGEPDVNSPTDNRPPETDGPPPTGGDNPGENRPNPNPDQSPENTPDTTDDTDDDRDREDQERTEAERREAEERARLEQIARDKHFNGSEVQQAMEVAAKTGRPMVMKFGADWCGPCRAMEAGTWNNGNVQNHMKENDVFTKVDVDANPELARQYGISSVPTTLIGNVTQGADGSYRFTPSERLSGNIGAYDMLNYLSKYKR